MTAEFQASRLRSQNLETRVHEVSQIALRIEIASDHLQGCENCVANSAQGFVKANLQRMPDLPFTEKLTELATQREMLF